MPDNHPKSVTEACEQAAEHFGFMASSRIQVEGGEIFEVPNPSMLDDDQQEQERYDELLASLAEYDREDVEMPEVKSDDGTLVAPARTLKGDLIRPHRKDGKLVQPPYNVRLAIALWGEEGYQRFKAGGGRSSQISIEWALMNESMESGSAKTRKVLVALAVWRRYPAEIEADLEFKGIDIGAWHRLDLRPNGVPVLSGRKLLTLLEKLPDDSEFKTAAERGGDWTIHQHIQKVIANELLYLRAGYHAVHGGESYTPTLFESPLELEMDKDDDDELDELRDDVVSQMQDW